MPDILSVCTLPLKNCENHLTLWEAESLITFSTVQCLLFDQAEIHDDP